jgi:hypothetical protein
VKHRPQSWAQVHENVRACVPRCPDHETAMVERTGRFGPFWSCPNRICAKTVNPTVYSGPNQGRARFWSGRPP